MTSGYLSSLSNRMPLAFWIIIGAIIAFQAYAVSAHAKSTRSNISGLEMTSIFFTLVLLIMLGLELQKTAKTDCLCSTTTVTEVATITGPGPVIRNTTDKIAPLNSAAAGLIAS